MAAAPPSNPMPTFGFSGETPTQGHCLQHNKPTKQQEKEKYLNIQIFREVELHPQEVQTLTCEKLEIVFNYLHAQLKFSKRFP